MLSMTGLLGFVIRFFTGVAVFEICLIVQNVLLADTLIPAGAEFRRWDFLCFRWERDLYAKGDKQGCLRFKINKFVFAPHLILDLTNLSKKTIKITDIINVAANLLLAGVCLVLSIMSWIDLSEGALRNVVFGAVSGFAVYILIFIMAIVRTVGKKNTFQKFFAEKLQERHQNQSIRGVELPPLSELVHLNPTEPQKMIYLDTRYRKCSFENDLAGMAVCVQEMELLNDVMLLPSNRFSRDSDLMDYYAFRLKDPVKAREYYEKSQKEIEDDRDCNGRRKLAYFSYFVLKDVEKAKACIADGFAALSIEDPLFTEEEKKYEEQMLTYLKGLIEQETAEKSL